MNANELQAWMMALYGAEKFMPGLDRIRQFLTPELTAINALNPTIVTVAGTNGKGETCYTLAEMARQSGVSFVLWTSPHILSVTERFQNAQGEISETELSLLLQEGEAIRQEAGVGLSYYEALWAAFLRWGLKQQPQLWIFEVGLGGRLDAVNLFAAQVVALTSISRDHQEFLGRTYRSILHEKLGVTRRDKTLISALEGRYLQELTEKHCQTEGVKHHDLFEQGVLSAKTSFSERNRRLAEAAWDALHFPKTSLPVGPFKARGEKWNYHGHEFVFYGTHNPDGMRKLVQFLSLNSYNNPKELIHLTWVAFSQRPSADLRAMAQMIRGLKTEVRFTQFNHPKAIALNEWWSADEGSSAECIHEWTELFNELERKEEQRILVVGSYYFVASVQAHLLSLGGQSHC